MKDKIKKLVDIKNDGSFRLDQISILIMLQD